MKRLKIINHKIPPFYRILYYKILSWGDGFEKGTIYSLRAYSPNYIVVNLYSKIFFNKGDKAVKYKVLESSEIPEKIKEILPKYLAEERALTLRLNDEIYVLVMRGEKKHWRL